MKYIFQVQARPTENPETVQRRFLNGLTELQAPWTAGNAEAPPPDFGRELLAEFKLTRLLGKGVKGSIIYKLRGEYMDDESRYDDSVFLEFNSDKVDFAYLVNTAAPAYIRAFNAYTAGIGLEEFIYIDAKRLRDVNFRNQVVRFHQAGYYDAELCRRALGLSPEEVVARVQGKVERAEVLENGAWIVASTKPMSIEEAEAAHATIAAALGRA